VKRGRRKMTYREKQLERARKEQEKARKAQDWELVEFWGNKVAFLENLRYGQFEDEK